MITNTIHINGNLFNSEKIKHKLRNEQLEDWEIGIYQFILNWFDQSNFIVQKTSGSTGPPKEILLKKSAMIASAKKTIQFFNLQETKTAWLCLPINYIAGKMMIVRAIVGNLNLLISHPEGTPKIPLQKVDFTAMVPLQVQKLIDDGNDFGTIGKLIIGGASTKPNLLSKLQNLPTEIYATYGMTETCSHIALQRLNGKQPDQYFQLLPGISISQNNENCMVIRAPHLIENEIETSDLVEIISNKAFKLIGRANNIINSGGIKILPEKLEGEITEIIDRECLIVPENDELLGQKIVLVLEGKQDSLLAKKILNNIKSSFQKHQSPKAVYFIKEFPRTPSMKIDRKAVIRLINRT